MTGSGLAQAKLDPQIPKKGRQREGRWGSELVRDKKIMGFPAGADNRARSTKGRKGLVT